ncbi:MAG: NAD(P)H-dependent oxidoreductase [Gammaproteobacteria bacterium]|nr:NAD(P)H-dependent oxidoreductase [Gammaproteobacteria bacterium]
MIRVGIIYFTKTDVTGQLASSLIAGVNSVNGVEVVEHKIEGHEIIEGRFINQELFINLKSCDAIVFGSPTYMGGVSAQFKSFADATSELWCEQEWSGKIAAGFTCGSALNGDQSSTLQYLFTLSSQHGMLWIGLDSAHGYKSHGVNRLGCQLGVVAHSQDNLINEIDLASARYLGARVAKYATQINSKTNNSIQST